MARILILHSSVMGEISKESRESNRFKIFTSNLLNLLNCFAASICKYVMQVVIGSGKLR